MVLKLYGSMLVFAGEWEFQEVTNYADILNNKKAFYMIILARDRKRQPAFTYRSHLVDTSALLYWVRSNAFLNSSKIIFASRCTICLPLSVI